MKTKRYHLLLFSILAIGIICLFLNDRMWKYEYSNLLTGNLSDFLGLLTLPVFIGILFSRIKSNVSLVVGVLFVLWKSPIADLLIDAWNQMGILSIDRTIDYTDLAALIVLPFVHKFIVGLDIVDFKENIRANIHPVFINLAILFSFIVFCSTSVVEPSYPKGNIYLNERFQISLTDSFALQKIRNSGLHVTTDSVRYFGSRGQVNGKKYYQISEMVVYGKGITDTLANVNFEIRNSNTGSYVKLLNATIKSDPWDLQDWEILKRKSNQYKMLVKNDLIKIIELKSTEQ